jgi:tetratricopeptide (TPR) repeat protein
MDKSSRKNFIRVVSFCIVLLPATLFSGSDEEFFLRGNNYYQKKEYEDSLKSYSMINNKGRAVLYNMGNCFFHKDDYAQALIYWSRAAKGATPSEYKSIIRNKEYVLKKMGKSRELSFFQKIEQFFSVCTLYVSLLFLQIFFLLCWLIFLFLRRKKSTRYSILFLWSLALLMVVTAMMMGISYKHSSAHKAIVVKKDAFITAAPHKGLYAIAPLAYAEEVTVKETREGWHKIGYAGIIGWVEAEVIGII